MMTDRPTQLTSDSRTPVPTRRFLAVAALGAVLAPFVVTAGSGSNTLTTPSSSALQCATARPVISQSDITYLGAIRTPLEVNTTFAYGGLTGRIVNGHVRLFLFGSNTATPQD